jgi:Bacterial tandem repeat domain 1
VLDPERAALVEGECDVLIAVIGSHWLTCVDEQGGRRLDNPEDFVRREIATALKRDIRVIPVLVDRASMPRSTDLPDDLKSLVRRNALEISDTGFDDDCRRLGVAIEKVLEKTKRERPERRENERLEAECRETEGKEHLAAEPEQKAERKPPGKRKPRFAAAMMLLLALAIGLAIVAAVYFEFLRPGPSPTVLGTAYWRTCYGMTASEYQRISDELKRQGFRLTDMTGYSVGGQARYAAIWEKRDGPPLQAPYGLTSAQYQQTFEDLRMRGYRPLRISAYSIEGHAFYAGVWEQSTGPAWDARHEMAAAEFQQVSDKLKGKGYRLTDVSGYDVGRQDRYAAIWEKSI